MAGKKDDTAADAKPAAKQETPEINLDRRLPFGTIGGRHEVFPTAKFQQHGALFDSAGKCLSLDGAKKYAKGSKEAAAFYEEYHTTGENVGAKLVKMSRDLAKAKRQLGAARSTLEKLKNSTDEEERAAPDYYMRVTEAQQTVTNYERKVTRLNNSAAVLEASIIADADDEAEEESDELAD